MRNRATLPRSDARITYIAAGRLAAAQWRAHLVREAMCAGRDAVLGTEVLPYRAWVANLWEARRAPGEPLLLSARQSRALWRRVIVESPDGDRLLGTEGAARWAEEAWRAAAAYGIDLDAAAGSAGRGSDLSAFIGWARDYRARLRDAGWIDDALLDRALLDRMRVDRALPDRALVNSALPDRALVNSALPDKALLDRVKLDRAPRDHLPGGGAVSRPAGIVPAELVLADVEPTPAQRALLGRFEALGTRVVERWPPAVVGRAAVLRCADPAEELAAAAEWAARSLASRPSACFAIVVPELGERHADVRRTVDAGASARLFVDGQEAGLDGRPLLGAMLNALELLLLPSAGFAALSRWLRSPFFHDAARAAAAVLERRLREEALAQVPFVEAYRHAGLRAQIRAALPEAAARLDKALELLSGPERRPPAAWAAVLPRALDALGAAWPAGGDAAAAERALYEDALVELARLTPIVGTVTASEALAELEAGMARERPAALPLAGVHVVARLEDVGPGYAGVWVTGATDDRLPRPVELRPFLPRDVQIGAGMPCSSPRDALARSRALMERVAARAPEIVYSWPRHVRDAPAEPSPLLGGLAVYRGADAPAAAVRARGGAARRRETIADPAPPLAGHTLPGGTAALNAQAVCPLRAFCEHRLGARPLVAVERGLSPAARGKILHRTLERLFRHFDSSVALGRAGPVHLQTVTGREARRAAAEMIGGGHPLLAAFVEVEAARAVEVVAALVARELERAPFRVESLELEQTLELGGRSLRARIDRVDALEGGALAVIDYKTGVAPKPSDWLGERLRDAQLPVYALALSTPRLGGVVATAVRPDRTVYSGFWEPPEAFPGRVRVSAELGLGELVDVWRLRLGALIAEYTAGDARLFVDDAEAASGAYAPLTRVYELLEPVAGALASPEAE